MFERVKNMRKLTLELPELQQIDINGDIFDIGVSDLDILNKGAELTAKYSRINDLTDESEKKEAAIAGANEIIAYIDKILGGGAVAKISKGRPVSIATACNWLVAICAEISSKLDEEKAKTEAKTKKHIGEKYE